MDSLVAGSRRRGGRSRVNSGFHERRGFGPDDASGHTRAHALVRGDDPSTPSNDAASCAQSVHTATRDDTGSLAARRAMGTTGHARR